MERIVVGTDGSEGSRAALRWAGAEARLRGATLDVVLAWEYPTSMVYPSHGTFTPPQTDMEGAAIATVQKVLADEGIASGDGIELRESIVHDAPAPALLHASQDADLLVVGSRGQGAFVGMLLGSVSQHCVTHATCPVVVVPSER
jgi:nucleotide-binding universal stress UspA family protein